MALKPEVDFTDGITDAKLQNNFAALAALDQTAGNNPAPLLKGIYALKATVNPSALGDGAGATVSVTFTGAELGDVVLVAAPYDLVDVTVSAYVQAANTIEIRVQNESGASPVDLASGTWNILLFDLT